MTVPLYGTHRRHDTGSVTGDGATAHLAAEAVAGKVLGFRCYGSLPSVAPGAGGTTRLNTLMAEPTRPLYLALAGTAQWTDVAAGSIDAQLDTWATWLATHAVDPADRPIVFTFHHEPENDGLGTPEEFVAAFQYVATYLDLAAYPNVRVLGAALTDGGWNGFPIGTNMGRPDPRRWYIGLESVIDLVGGDHYTRYPDSGTLEQLSTLAANGVAQAGSMGLPYFVGEMGCHATPGNAVSQQAKAAWITNAYTYMKTINCGGGLYSDVDATSPTTGHALNYRVDSDPVVTSAWQAANGIVTYDASSESHTGTTGSTLELSFNWTHTPVSTPKGVLVFVMQNNSSTDKTSTVTYGGTTVPLVPGGFAADTTGEPRSCKAFFLGAGVPTGAQSVVVNRTNDSTVMWAVAVTVDASQDTEVYTPGIVLQQSDTSLAAQNVSDGLSVSNSLRFAAISSALNSGPGADTGSVGLQAIDFGPQVAQVVRETTAGTGSRPVGFSSATVDDVAAVYLAVREQVTVVSIPVTPGAVTLAGASGITLIVPINVPVVPGAVALAGGVNFTITRKTAVTRGRVTLTGKVIVFGGSTVFIVVPVVGGSLRLGTSGQWSDLVNTWSDAAAPWNGSSIVVTGAGSITSITPGAVTLAGAAIVQTRTISATVGAVTLAGQVIIFTGFTVILVDPGPNDLTLAGASVAVSVTISATIGAVRLAGAVISVAYKTQVTIADLAIRGQVIVIDIPVPPPAVRNVPPNLITSPELPGLEKLRKRHGLTR